MKQVRWLVLPLIVIPILAAIGCSEVSPTPGTSQVNNCLICHTDEATLQELAVEEEHPMPEASSGEG